jgi:toxin ParE1/3/4
MAYRVNWSQRALDDLEAIAQYIYLDSTAYAKAVVKTVLERTHNFSRFPYAGRIVPEFSDQSIRENNVVTVAAIIHGKRLLDINDL